MKTFRLLLTLAFLAPAIAGFSQQQATYAQYMFNGLAINPAYAGSQGALSVNFLSRFQNVGLPGAPNTQTLAIHSPIANQRFAVGFLAVHDQIGVISQTGINGIYAYRIPVGKNATLSLGLQIGMAAYRADYSQLSVYQSDVIFATDVRQNRLNFGGGVYYSNATSYVGLSMPHMANNVFERKGSLETVYQSVPIILTAGHVFEISRILKVKPNFLFKAVDGRAVELDLNANFLFDEVVWLGVSYKFQNAVALLTQLQVTDQLQVGYSYSITTGAIQQAELGSHELLVQYRFKYSAKGVVTPRYF
jgi:type IX secretion system PorP/SprF family membrane protein